jgi:hypothetical protein
LIEGWKQKKFIDTGVSAGTTSPPAEIVPSALRWQSSVSTILVSQPSVTAVTARVTEPDGGTVWPSSKAMMAATPGSRAASRSTPMLKVFGP